MVLRFVLIALIAGVIGGAVNFLVQTRTTIPMIKQAESVMAFGADEMHSDNHGNSEGEGHEEGEAWMPEDGGERVFYSILTTVGTGFGYGLILLAAMILMNQPITMRSGLFYGLLGFLATGLAPALGLPPQLPGSASAYLEMRQLWWVITVAMTVAGLWFIISKGNELKIMAGLTLIALPHIFGAPHPHDYFSELPAEFASQFTMTSLMLHLLLWLIIGAVSGYLWHYQESRDS